MEEYLELEKEEVDFNCKHYLESKLFSKGLEE